MLTTSGMRFEKRRWRAQFWLTRLKSLIWKLNTKQEDVKLWTMVHPIPTCRYNPLKSLGLGIFHHLKSTNRHRLMITLISIVEFSRKHRWTYFKKSSSVDVLENIKHTWNAVDENIVKMCLKSGINYMLEECDINSGCVNQIESELTELSQKFGFV